VGKFCEDNQLWMPSLKRILSAGAPVPPRVLEKMVAAAPQCEMYTPYGATEALPVASISASEVLQETATQSAEGKGTCVGKRFDGIEWQVIAIHDDPISDISEIEPVEPGQIGELIVKGPVVTRRYATSEAATKLAKIAENAEVWHRMGDVGYLDQQDRFWFCGRKSHRVLAAEGPMFTVPIEGIVNTHPAVFRSALVGVGKRESQIPVVIVEPWPSHYPDTPAEIGELTQSLLEWAWQHEICREIQHVLIHPSFPVDVRHNSKIFREKLAVWAEERLEPVLKNA